MREAAPLRLRRATDSPSLNTTGRAASSARAWSTSPTRPSTPQRWCDYLLSRVSPPSIYTPAHLADSHPVEKIAPQHEYPVLRDMVDNGSCGPLAQEPQGGGEVDQPAEAWRLEQLLSGFSVPAPGSKPYRCVFGRNEALLRSMKKRACLHCVGRSPGRHMQGGVPGWRGRTGRCRGARARTSPQPRHRSRRQQRHRRAGSTRRGGKRSGIRIRRGRACAESSGAAFRGARGGCRVGVFSPRAPR